MSSHVFTVNLKDDPAVIETYKRHHREIWPEVRHSLLTVGVERMDIHLLGRTLVMVVEMRNDVDYLAAFSAHACSSPRVAEWERLMKSLQEQPACAKPGEWWARMERVFHLASAEQQERAIAHVADRPRVS